jgi:hypothetical protein
LGGGAGGKEINQAQRVTTSKKEVLKIFVYRMMSHGKQVQNRQQLVCGIFKESVSPSQVSQREKSHVLTRNTLLGSSHRLSGSVHTII